MIIEMTPSVPDLDLEVYKEIGIGGGCDSRVLVGTSTNGGSAKETVVDAALGYITYWIKTYRYSGSATGTVTAKPALAASLMENAITTAISTKTMDAKNLKCDVLKLLYTFHVPLIYFIRC